MRKNKPFYCSIFLFSLDFHFLLFYNIICYENIKTEAFYGLSLEGFTWQQAVMWVIGSILIYLAIKKDMQPALLLPMGFGAILVNLPLSPVVAEHGIITSLFEVGIAASEAMPLLLFIGIGCMTDFGPLLTNPKLFILGGAAQLGIFVTIILAAMIGFPLNDAASIGIIGAADGPTAILVAIGLIIIAVKVTAFAIDKATEAKKNHEEKKSEDENSAQ